MKYSPVGQETVGSERDKSWPKTSKTVSDNTGQETARDKSWPETSKTVSDNTGQETARDKSGPTISQAQTIAHMFYTHSFTEIIFGSSEQ